MDIRAVLMPFLWVDIDCKTWSYGLRIFFVLGIGQFYHIFDTNFRLWEKRNNFSFNATMANSTRQCPGCDLNAAFGRSLFFFFQLF